MTASPERPVVTFCVLTYGDYPQLLLRALEPILQHCPRHMYRLVVGANAVSPAIQDALELLQVQGSIDRLVLSRQNINKCPMMRRMFTGIDTEYVWWFDDDSYISDPRALPTWLHMARTSPPETVMWGQEAWFNDVLEFSYGTDVSTWIKQAGWYRGLPPPGEAGSPSGRWNFLNGGCWLIRTSAIRALDWPDRRLIKRNDDVFLGEAIRQQGWQCMHLGPLGVVINGAETRGDGEDRATMEKQMSAKG